MQRKPLPKKSPIVIVGQGELFSLLQELKASDKLTLKSTSYESSIEKIQTPDTVLYVGGLGPEALSSLKKRTTNLYSASLDYNDIKTSDELGIPTTSFTEYVKVRKGIWFPVIKRLVDIVLSAIGIIVASPVMLVTAIFVRVKLGSPVLFSQERPGKYEKVFKVYKFRSMSNAKGPDGELLPDSQRLTRFGKILRSTSLDELPQFFSIFKGTMSIIGPRPQSFENVYFMNPRQRLRHCVTPGLTGYSQVSGRNAIPWDEKIQHDLEYIEHISFTKDMKIFIKTIAMVLMRKDITQQGSVSTESVGEFLLRTGQINEECFHQGHHDARNWESLSKKMLFIVRMKTDNIQE